MGAPPLVDPAEVDLVSSLQDRGGLRALQVGAATLPMGANPHAAPDEISEHLP
jgi:hypothetical protein